MRIGASLEMLASLRMRFEIKAEEVAQIIAGLEAQVAMISSGEWEGPAALRFQEIWRSDFRPQMEALHGALRDASEEIRRRSEALMQAGS